MSWTFYNTNGHKLSSSAASVGVSSRVKGFVGLNNASTPNTQYDVSAAELVLLNPADGSTVVRYNTSTITNNISTSGPAANGRDQSGAFSNSSWIHVYFIWNGTSDATVTSASGPATGPTLPSGYTHWVYATSLRINSSGNIVLTRCRGSNAWYEEATVLVSDGTATTDTIIDLSAVVPFAVGLAQFTGRGLILTDSGGPAESRLLLGFGAPIGSRVEAPMFSPATSAGMGGFTASIPFNGSAVVYKWSDISGGGNIIARGAFVSILSYLTPNGDS